ncbi:MAG: copper resistance protein B [Acidobacteriota bacterium]|nr:MAG: copper resistance protein B [Acidobacteriota bacterium]
MKILNQIGFLTALIFTSGAVFVSGQTPTPMASPTPTKMDMEMPTPTPTPSPKKMDMPMDMNMPMKVPSPTPIVPDKDEANKSPIPQYPPPKSWGKPVEDELPHSYILVDLLEFSPKRGDSNVRWDTLAWYGGDFNRIWLKSEGEISTIEKDYKIDLQILYGRFVKTYYDFQIGGRVQTNTFRGKNATRVQGVVGIQGLRPYKYEIEALAFLDPKGNVSGRFTASRDYLMTQRLVLQPRFETELSIQEVERFKTGRGLNNIGLGLRLRYAIRREFAPYIGISYERSFFSTADLIRQDGGNPSQIRFVMGVRLWR